MKSLKLTYLIKTILFCISTICLWSCSNNNPKSLNAIPQNTDMVAAVDVYSIIKKGKLNEVSSYNFFKTFKKEIRNENKKASRIMTNIIEDPGSTGIDFTEDLFIYYIDEAKDEQFLCMTIDLNKEDQFATFLEDVLDKTELTYDIEKEKTYKYTILKNELAIAWDKEKVVFLLAENRSSRVNLDLEIEILFKLDATKQIMEKEEFATFYGKKKDLSIWFSPSMFENNYSFKKVVNELDFDISDNYMSAYLDFGKDNISLIGEVTPDKDFDKKMKENNFWKKQGNPKLLGYLPNESYANASMSIDPVAYYNLMKDEKGFDKIKTKFNKDTGFGVKEFMSSLNGNIVFSLIGFDQVENTYISYFGEEKTRKTQVPLMGLTLDMNTDNYIKQLVNEIPEEKLHKRNDYYEIELDNTYSAYLAFSDNVCFLTNDKNSIRAFKDGGFKTKSLSNSDHASHLLKSGYYAYMNLDYKDYPSEVKSEIEKKQNRKEEKLFKIWDELASSIELKQIDDYSVELNLKTSKRDSNSLSTLITVLDDNYKDYLGL